jgi:hypothetical protein
MQGPEETAEPAIGERLAQARAARELDLREVEAETKIRLKYLRALEAGDWDLLPGPAYAVGFLRTYAELLGLDADVLVADLRSQIDEGGASEERYPAGEPVLRGRQRSRGRGWGARILVVVLGLALLALAAFTVLQVLDEEPSVDEVDAPPGEPRRQRSDAGNGSQPESSGPVTLNLALRDDVPVCLLGDGPQPLIDNQVLGAGSEEEFTAERFELRFPDGFERSQLRLELDGETTRLEPGLAAAFKLRGPDEVKPVSAGDDCP